VNYAQLLTEANSDVPSPILAQILSGPLAGGRAIGKFKVSYDYLIIEFSLINHKGKDYSVSALALDPDTTLAGMATEVDHRYFSRVILPAAGAFVSEFGRVMSEPTQEVTTTETTTTVTQTERGIEDATYAGVGSAANTISRFLEREGQRIQPLVRVAVGTPMGIFFLQPVKESGKSSGQNVTNSKEIPPGYYPAAYGNGSMQPQMQQPTGQDTYQMNTYKPAQGMIVTPNSGQMPYSGYNYNR
jgi:intracellular multiplication protein IcmE